jgi:RNA polymerase sigma factor (TIGR02999 family)
MIDPSRLSQIQQRFEGTDAGSLDRLIPVLYDRLRALAHHRLRAAPGEPSLSTTGLVHEAYLRLVSTPALASLTREHFLAIASRVMRNVLVDQARARRASKRGGGQAPVALQEEMWVAHIDLEGVADLDEALKKLEALDPRQGEIIEHRYFGGLSLEETAAAMRLSLATVKRELRLARAWLAAELSSRNSR